LEDINLTVQEKDFIGIIGPNGGGKTTLVKVILGLVPLKSGSIKIFNHPQRDGRRYLGYVPQGVSYDTSFPINVSEVVGMGLLRELGFFQSFTKKETEKVNHALNQMNIYPIRKKPLGELSGGQRQRVYIARALLSDPKILLLDEPTANIDPNMSWELYEILNLLNQNITIILISHDMTAVTKYVKTVGCLNRKLHYHGSKTLTSEMLEEAYQCPVDLIAHGIPHRVFSEHDKHE